MGCFEARSQAGIFFGYLLTLPSLITAGFAFRKLEQPLAAIKLIQLRRQAGTLFTRKNEHKAILNLPIEIWRLVEQELVTLELEAARRRLTKKVLCKACIKRGITLDSVDPKCDECDELQEALLGWKHDGCLDSCHVLTFLRATELRITHPEDVIAPKSHAGSYSTSLNSLVPVGLPMPSTSSRTDNGKIGKPSQNPTAYCFPDGDHEDAEGWATIEFQPAAFAVSTASVNRLRALVKLYQLDPSTVAKQNTTPKSDPAAGTSSVSTNMKEAGDETSDNSIDTDFMHDLDPRWILLNSCSSWFG